MEAQPAKEHPQLLVAPEVCGRIGVLSQSAVLERIGIVLPNLVEQYRSHLHWGRFDKAMDCAEQASALALAACGRELRQAGHPFSCGDLAEELRRRIQPHKNRGSLSTRHSELATEIQSVLALDGSADVRTTEEKLRLAYRWMELAVSCAKIPVKYEADERKQQQKQQQVQYPEPQMRMEMG